MSDDKPKAGVWLGAAASAVAVLAFFGVNSFDQLTATLDPTSAALDSCEEAYQAWQENGMEPGDYRVYSRTILAIADETEDEKLKAILRTEGDAAEEMAAALIRNDASTSDALLRSNDATIARQQYCSELEESN